MKSTVGNLLESPAVDPLSIFYDEIDHWSSVQTMKSTVGPLLENPTVDPLSIFYDETDRWSSVQTMKSTVGPLLENPTVDPLSIFGDFNKYVNNKIVNKSGVAALKGDSGDFITEDCAKAEKLNAFFISVFTIDSHVLPVDESPPVIRMMLTEIMMSLMILIFLLTQFSE
jgi:hypothetical protein